MSRKRIAALLTALLLLAMLALGASADRSVDLSRFCSLHLSTSATADLKNAHVVLDLYRVAEAGQSGEQVRFNPVTGLEGLGLENVSESGTAPQSLAGQTAAAVLDKSLPAVVTGAAADTAIPGLTSGLYLVLARGESVTDWLLRDASGSVTATVAESEQYRYQFAPELVALPCRPDGGTEWIYDLTGSLKATQERKGGVLELSKTLESYNPALGTATFVFDVEAVLDRDGKTETVYSDVLTLSFSETGTKTLSVELPIGAQVTVTEVYTGASYERSGGAQTQSVTVTANKAAQVPFTNRWNGGTIGGTSVTNHFEYSVEKSQWEWKPLADSTGA